MMRTDVTNITNISLLLRLFPSLFLSKTMLAYIVSRAGISSPKRHRKGQREKGNEQTMVISFTNTDPPLKAFGSLPGKVYKALFMFPLLKQTKSSTSV